MDSETVRILPEPTSAAATDTSVDAIVPFFNESASSLSLTLRGLNSQTLSVNQVILVDDGSTSPPDLRAIRAIPNLQTQLFRLPENRGISAGRNFGAAHSEAKYLLFVNAEIELVPEWVGNAVGFLENHAEAGLVCGQVRAIREGALTEWRKLYLDLKPETWIDQTHEIDWAVGHALLISRAQFTAVGGWDERFRRAYEDVDLCSRIRNQGKKIFQVEGAISICHSSLSIKQLAAKQVRNCHWNLDYQYQGDPALRPFEFPSTINDFLSRSRRRFESNLKAKRWEVAVVEFAVFLRGTALLVPTSFRRHAALGSSPFKMWLAQLPERFARKLGRIVAHVRSR